MAKIRLIFLLLTFTIVGVFATLAFLYARGYRLNTDTLEVTPSGLLVIKSHPDGAQVFINGELKTATNTTIPLPPDTYDVSVKKEGYLEWRKRLTIKKEEVTEATAHLFKSAPSLSAVTFTGVSSPVLSPDLTKIAYIIPDNEDRKASGLWIMETVNLPLGFSREPRKITDGDLENATFLWSSDSRQILLKTPKGSFILDTGVFTPQSKLINVASSETTILTQWQQIKEKRLSSQIKKLPQEMQDILTRKASSVVFSFDEDIVLYTASGSATIPEHLIKPIPGASTQKQERDIKPGRTYVYDIKEDRNFFITDEEVLLAGWVSYKKFIEEKPKTKAPLSTSDTKLNPILSWFPSSRHLILAEEGKITIMDYDGTNRQIVYAGNYVSPFAFPTLSLDRLLILTNLGANSSTPNFYSLGIK